MPPTTSSATWTCPVCDRRVPRRVDECWCGVKQTQATSYEAKERALAPARLPRGIVAPLVLLGVIGIWALAKLDSDERTIVPLASPTATPATVTGQRTRATPISPSRDPGFGPPRQEAPPPAAAVSAAAAAPSPASPAATSSADPEEQGARALNGALEAAVGRAEALGRRYQQYVEVCQGRRLNVVSNCEDVQEEVRRMAAGVTAELEAAEDQARRASVKPGTLRALRSKHHIDEWQELARGLQTLKR